MAGHAFVATRKGLFELAIEDSGRSSVVASHFVGEPVVQVMIDQRDNAIYAALRLGHFGPKLHRSDDDGKTFHEITSPAFPKSADGGKSVDMIWVLAAAGDDMKGRIYCGTIPAAFFVSDDKGASWRLIPSLHERPEAARWFGGGYDHPGIHSLCVHPKDSRHVIAGISCGGVWETRDGGDNWSMRTDGLFAVYVPPEQRADGAIQDPHCIAACAAAPDTLWMQHHNGMFKSSDGGRNWKPLAPVPVSDFGFVAVAHPTDPGIAWFLPAVSDEKRHAVDGAICVLKTTDGGASFRAIRKGLPQNHAYDLFYRHGADCDASGKYLVIGSTSGGVFTSADGGESWAALDARLPPVYAVRFRNH